jgi:hypothetical protein
MSEMSETEAKKCVCENPATHECANCKKMICDDINCGQDTVDGYLCGSYTQWGCSRKYTTCDVCLDDKAIHEGDLNFCSSCGNAICDQCVADNTCPKCEDTFCENCREDHVDECGD